MTYQQLDAIADGVNPALAILALVLPFLVRPAQQYGRLVFLLSTGVSMAVMYAIAWADRVAGLWSAFRLDYSQHTGFAAVLVFSLFAWNRRLGVVLVIVLIGYIVPMLYQEYHTIPDILTTELVIVSATLAIQPSQSHCRASGATYYRAQALALAHVKPGESDRCPIALTDFTRKRFA